MIFSPSHSSFYSLKFIIFICLKIFFSKKKEKEKLFEKKNSKIYRCKLLTFAQKNRRASKAKHMQRACLETSVCVCVCVLKRTKYFIDS